LTGSSINKVSISGEYDATVGLIFDIDSSVKSLDVLFDDFSYDFGGGFIGFDLLIGKSVETLNFTASGSDSRSIISKIEATNGTGSVKLNTITLTGDADFKIDLSYGSDFSRVKTFDASSATGELDIQVGKLSNGASIIGGAGDDIIRLTAEGVRSYVTLTGGAGEDVFDLTSADFGGAISITDFEKGEAIVITNALPIWLLSGDIPDKTSDIVKGFLPDINSIMNSNSFNGNAKNTAEYFHLNNDVYLVIYGNDQGTKLDYDDLIIRLIDFSEEDAKNLKVIKDGIIAIG